MGSQQKTLEEYLGRVEEPPTNVLSEDGERELSIRLRRIRVLRDLKPALEYGAKAEELGREIAALYRDETPGQVRPRIRDWSILVREANSYVTRAKWYAGDRIPLWVSATMYRAQEWVSRVQTFIETECPRDQPISECILSEESLGARQLKARLRHLDELAEEGLGKRCTWLLGVKEPYTVTAAINDVTACFHRALEFLQAYYKEISPGQFTERGRCVIEEGADPAAAEACAAWSEAVEEMGESLIMTPGDRNSLAGFVRDGEVELKVGSAPGHAVHISLGKGQVQYFDHDEGVNRVLKTLLERYAGLNCRIEREEDKDLGVVCTGLDKGNVGTAAKMLAAATSMDFRLSDWERVEAGEDSRYWPEKIVKGCQKEYGEWGLKVKLKKPEEILEFCAVVKWFGLE